MIKLIVLALTAVLSTACATLGHAVLASRVVPHVVRLVDGDRTYCSGVILSQRRIVTNDHCVVGKEDTAVVMQDGRMFPVKVVGRSPDNDLALLATAEPLLGRAAVFGDSSRVKQGDAVMAVGHPYGLTYSVTVGVISAIDRNMGIAYSRVFQTDAAINPGNSGGALFNMDGELIGINALYITNGLGGFAIPSNRVAEIVQQMEEKFDGR